MSGAATSRSVPLSFSKSNCQPPASVSHGNDNALALCRPRDPSSGAGLGAVFSKLHYMNESKLKSENRILSARTNLLSQISGLCDHHWGHHILASPPISSE